jgi:agmatine/peptidylarginine deiminase
MKDGDIIARHIDGLARFIAPRKIVASRPNTPDGIDFSEEFQ